MKITHYLSLLLISIVAISCSSDTDPDTNYVYVSPENKQLNFNSGSSTQSFALFAGCEWRARIGSDGSSWAHINGETSGIGDAVISITLDKNTTPNERRTTLEITTTQGASLSIPILQQAPYLRLSVHAVNFDYTAGESQLITVDTEGEFEITSDASWVTVNNNNDGTFTIRTTENTTQDVRTATVTAAVTGITEGEVADNVKITQIFKSSINADGFSSDNNWN